MKTYIPPKRKCFPTPTDPQFVPTKEVAIEIYPTTPLATKTSAKNADQRPTDERDEALDAFCAKWDEGFPTVGKMWRQHWTNLSSFFNYPEPIRKAIYTTNAIESINSQLRKVTKKRGAFPKAGYWKILYLAITKASERWSRSIKDWVAALNHLRKYTVEQNLRVGQEFTVVSGVL